jgi:iron complex transport system substrate-binding protein
VAGALGRAREGGRLVASLEQRLRRLEDDPAARRPRVVCVEWLEPLYIAGHWVPELVEAAGATDVGAAAGSHSARREWRDLVELHPDVVVVMLCGFGVERALVELAALAEPAARALLAAVPTWVIDGNAYTSRAGPRIVDGAELLAGAFRDTEATGIHRYRTGTPAPTRAG